MSSNKTCSCGHHDSQHLRKVGPCIYHKGGEYCGCDSFRPFQVYMPSSEKVPAKGEWITITGEVKNVGKDIQNAPCIALRIDPPIDSVRCVFPASSTSRVATVTVGARVMIRGRCAGTPTNALLQECQLF